MRKLNNIAIAMVGVSMILMSPMCLWGSSLFNAELGRWKAARFVGQAGEFAAIPTGSDVAILGSIAPQTAAPREGLAIYEEWQRASNGRGWQVTVRHQPAFELLLGEQSITVQSTDATLYNTREVLVSTGKLDGFAPGSPITVLGRVTSPDEPFQVQAEVICGGGRDECMGQFSSTSTIFVVVTIVLLLAGIGLAWLGVRRLRG